MIGVINNTNHVIRNFTVQAPNIFSDMEGDGIDTFTGITNAASAALFDPGFTTDQGTVGYGGADAYFTNVNFATDFGTVNFLNGIAPGGFDYFSLEESIIPCAPPEVGQLPEPASMALFGVGLLSLSLSRRCKH